VVTGSTEGQVPGVDRPLVQRRYAGPENTNDRPLDGPLIVYLTYTGQDLSAHSAKAPTIEKVALDTVWIWQ
jgi:hypothetical protein